MTATVAVGMVQAELLKLRRKPSTVGWALLLAVGSLVVFFLVRQLNVPPAGGVHGFAQGLNVLGLLVGPLAAVMIGAEAGAGDEEAGVYRDLVVTGRSRLALFAARIPGALALTLAVAALGFGVLVAGTFAFQGSLPAPSASLIVESALWIALADGLLCVIAVGLGSLMGLRATITTLIGWQLVVSPILVRTQSVGWIRHLLLDAPLATVKPGPAIGRFADLTMSDGAAVAVIAGWILLACALGAWRAATRDA